MDATKLLFYKSKSCSISRPLAGTEKHDTFYHVNMVKWQKNMEMRHEMKRFMQEFKEFALRGNVISLAVGMIIGMAFQDVVTSLTENILSPILGLFIGQNFDALTLELLGVTLRYGAFITSVINFFILAFVVFLIVRAMNKLLNAKANEGPESPSPLCPFCKTGLQEGSTRCPACTSELPE